jgi:hypothetical protein
MSTQETPTPKSSSDAGRSGAPALLEADGLGPSLAPPGGGRLLVGLAGASRPTGARRVRRPMPRRRQQSRRRQGTSRRRCWGGAGR